MAGKVDLPHPVGRDAAQEGGRIEPVIDAADMDVVDVQQQVAAGFPRQFRQELPLAHRAFREGHVA